MRSLLDLQGILDMDMGEEEDEDEGEEGVVEKGVCKFACNIPFFESLPINPAKNNSDSGHAARRSQLSSTQTCANRQLPVRNVNYINVQVKTKIRTIILA